MSQLRLMLMGPFWTPGGELARGRLLAFGALISLIMAANALSLPDWVSAALLVLLGLLWIVISLRGQVLRMREIRESKK